MMSQPIYGPPVPFCGLVPGGVLQTNLMIKINGNIKPAANTFAINLQVGPRVNPRDDLALHLSPIFTHPQRVVRNSLQNLTWGAEESYGGFPFVTGQTFEVIILVEYNCYKIAINGFHFTEFAHRIPFNRVSHLTIDGDVYINSIIYESLNNDTSRSNPQMPFVPTGGGGAVGGIPPYPTSGPSHGNFVPPTFPNTGYNPGPSTNYNPQYIPNQPYPTQPGSFGPMPQGVYPSTSTNYNAYAQPQGKPYKNKNKIFGSGILPAAGAIGGTLLGASLLSRAVPKMKIFKGPKFFKHKGFGKHKGYGFGMMGKAKGWGGFKGPKFGKFKGPKW